jgi:hypothetical protein
MRWNKSNQTAEHKKTATAAVQRAPTILAPARANMAEVEQGFGSDFTLG